jgi:hypothetical protein
LCVEIATKRFVTFERVDGYSSRAGDLILIGDPLWELNNEYCFESICINSSGGGLYCFGFY